MAAKAKLTPIQRQRIAEVLAARQALPSDKEMAREFGVSVAAIRWTMGQLLQTVVMHRARATLSKMLVSRGTKAGTLPRCQRLERSAMLSASES